MYLDDAVTGAVSPDTASNDISQAVELLSLANMPVHKLNTNNVKVKQYIQDKGLQSEFPDVTKVLGLTWDTVNDSMYTDLTQFADFELPENVTKTDVLSLPASIWDPTGILSPYMLEVRLAL